MNKKKRARNKVMTKRGEIVSKLLAIYGTVFLAYLTIYAMSYGYLWALPVFIVLAWVLYRNNSYRFYLDIPAEEVQDETLKS